MDAWRFTDGPDVLALTARQVMSGAAILFACRDSEDGGWQFLTGEPIEIDDAMLVSLQSIVERDPTVVELADLPLGWEAERDHVGAPWARRASEDYDDSDDEAE